MDTPSKFQVGDWVKVVGRGDKWDGTVGTVQNLKVKAYNGPKDLYTIHKNDVGDVIKVDWSDNVLSFFEDQLVAFQPAEEAGVGLSRYTKGMPSGIEARHIMETQDWYEQFCKGSILKYITRLDHKGQYLSDLKKIKAYAEELIRLVEEDKKLSGLG